MTLGTDHGLITGLLALSLLATAMPAMAQGLPPVGELARTGPNADCDERSCDQLQIDTDEHDATILDTEPAADAAGPIPSLYWGPEQVTTTADASLRSLDASDSLDCTEGDVAKFDASSRLDWTCSPDDVNGGNADKLDGLDAESFARAGHLHDDRYFTKDEANETFLDLTTYDSDDDGLIDDAEQAADSDTLDGFDSSDFLDVETYDTDGDGLADKAEDADTLDGLNSSDFWTKDAQTLQRLAGDEECDLGDVPAIINGIFGCQPDDVDGGNADTLDGFNSSNFSTASGQLNSSTSEIHETVRAHLDTTSIEKKKDGTLTCTYRPSMRLIDGQPDTIFGEVLVDGDIIERVDQSFHPGAVFHAGFEDVPERIDLTLRFGVEGDSGFSLEESPNGTTSFAQCNTVDARTGPNA